MVCRGHRPAGPLALPDRPVLVERGRALDTGRVGTNALVNAVRGAVAGHSTLVGQARRWVVRAVRLDNVVLDQRAGGPAVDAEIGVARGRERAGVFDRSVGGISKRC